MGDLPARYRLSGVVLESNVALPELPVATGDPSYTFELSNAGRTPSRPLWFHHWQQPGDRRWLSFARTAGGYLLRFPSLVDFEVSREEADGVPWRVRACPQPGVPPETVRHLLLDQVWPLVLSGAGRLVMHASAVVLPDGRAVAFAGAAGAGKSSLAAWMAMAGCRVVSDDCLVVEESEQRWRCVPSYPGLRLWPDTIERLAPGAGGTSDVAHYTDKQRVTGDALPFASDPASLAAVFLLRPLHAGDKAAMVRLDGAAVIMELVPFTYILDCEARDQLERSFAQLAALTAAVPVLRLDVPHAVSRLAEVSELVTHRL
jgi:hypothetical protein